MKRSKILFIGMMTTAMIVYVVPADESAQNAQYYTLVDVLDLAEKEGVVLMYGPGFSAPEGTVRISLANLNEEDYVEIARRLFELLDEYYEEYDREVLLENAA